MPNDTIALTSSAIVDIGSNSVRMVIYETEGRFPVSIFNEKVLCGLGNDMNRTGMLSDDGLERAKNAIPRFVRLARELKVGLIDIIATAAVRDAKNGHELVNYVKDQTGLDIRVISGREEARLSGLGVLSGIPSAKGVMGDLGGGSVELVALDRGETGRQETLPLGPLRFRPEFIQNPDKARSVIRAHLRDLVWPREHRGEDFYAVGGAWRNLARIHMNLTGYPLNVSHQYTIPGDEAIVFMRAVERMSMARLETMEGINKRRAPNLPYAACLMTEILEMIRPENVVFSAYGLREGSLYDHLDEDIRAQDPLIAACQQFSRERIRSVVELDGEKLYDWINPIFGESFDSWRRVIKASCFMADISRWEHPDYRAEHALERVLRFPITGADHRERAFMANAVAARHSRVSEEMVALSTIRYLLNETEMTMSASVGLAIRFALTLSGGDFSNLDGIEMVRESDRLVVKMSMEKQELWGEVCAKRFKSLAKSMELDIEIQDILL